MTPDVPRLREIHDEPKPTLTGGFLVDWILRRQDRILDALLAEAPPDGAAERAARAHHGDPCRYCGTPHDEVAPGPCPARTPAPTEAPAAETGRTDTPPWDDPAFLAAVRARGVKMLAVHAEFDGIDFAAGWNAALAARPAAVTDAMVALPFALKKMREAGWSVAVHNDYRLAGKAMTFWLFTHANGRYVKGEAETDLDAVTLCMEGALAARGPA